MQVTPDRTTGVAHGRASVGCSCSLTDITRSSPAENSGGRSVAREGPVDDQDAAEWRVRVLDTGTPEGAAERDALVADGKVRHRFDTLDEQLR